MRLRLGIGTAGLLCLALAGCGGGGTTADTGATGGGPGTAGQASGSVAQQARATWLDYARCIRAHGHPDFPDPQVDSQGHATFGGDAAQDKAMAQQAQPACGPVLQRLPASVRGQAPVTPAVLRQEALFAACLRRNGLPQWPDPRPDGTFPLAGTPYATMGKHGPVQTALQACRRFDTFGGIAASQP